MEEVTLLVLAAGKSTRFGRLKQLEPVGPHKEFLMDYSIYDAIKAGFNKVVFIIREETYEDFKNTIGKSLENKIKVEYVFQDIDDLTAKYEILKQRTKPLGTTHAILKAKNVINGPFMIINADDFYGYEVFEKGYDFLSKNYNQCGALLYKIGNTLSDNGVIKRGLCKVEDGYLVDATECEVQKINDKIMAKPLNLTQTFWVKEDDLTSLNLFLLNDAIFPLLEEKFNDFISSENTNLLKDESLLIEDLFKLVEEDKITIKTKVVNAKWFGMTYEADKEQVVKNIQNLIENNYYPANLR